MGYRSWCDDDDEHRRQARDDFRRGGSYGYDREKYRDSLDACNEEYTREFDRLRREDDNRRERMEEERTEERAAERRAYERQQREAEEAAFLYGQQQVPEEEFTDPADECTGEPDTPTAERRAKAAE